MGWIPVELTGSDPLLQDLRSPSHVYACHFDEVWDPPAPWKTLARSRGCSVQAMRFGDAPIWGIQAHPETGPDEARTLMTGLRDRNPAKAQIFEAALESTARDDDVAGAIVKRFLESGS